MSRIFDQDIFQKAWNFASIAHRDQKVPGTDIPYLNHIGNVSMEVVAALTEENVQNPDLSIQCALLHDVIEDTDVTFDEVKNTFGEDVAAGVLSLTKDTNIPSKEGQMKDSLKRILMQPPEVHMVKLADRITNLQPPPKHWDGSKIEKYMKEAVIIHDALYKSSRSLSERILKKIENYRKYLK